MPRALPKKFYQRDTQVVARELLGRVLAFQQGRVVRRGRIVETEAYLGPHDLACHSAKGKTPRTEVMFGPAGISYVYLIYGMYHCLNIVTGNGAAVLIRALELSGEDVSVKTDGPGKLTRALGITREHNNHPLWKKPLWVEEGEPVAERAIQRGPRIGVDYAGAWAPKNRFDFGWLRHREVSRVVVVAVTAQDEVGVSYTFATYG